MEEEEDGEEEEKEEEEDKEEKEERTQEQLSDTEAFRTSSRAVLLSEPRNLSEGLVNPAYSPENSPPSSHSRLFSRQGRPVKSHRWACLSRDRPYGHCRSLSSSVENMTFSGNPLCPMRGSFPSLNETLNKESLSSGRSFRDDTSLRCSKMKGINTEARKHYVLQMDDLRSSVFKLGGFKFSELARLSSTQAG